ncbi:aldo/keto reductase [Actinomadura sp. SCN-SB]|uniref:aldo/keto reductase n=1 Tax=Actinomadura sp. SCN-SB TaxID=3373092 RepID=UPI00375052B5
MTMTSVPTVRLSDGRLMPRLGLGTYPMDDATARTAVRGALGLGYRLIDTAASYGNEAGVGQAVADSPVPREEVFLVTKLRGARHGFEEALRGFEESRAALGVGYVDLYLIHWPLPCRRKYVDAWRALIELRERGLARSIGVSNFTPAMIERLVAETGVRPVVNQIEMHPSFTQEATHIWHADHGIVTMSYSPFGRGTGGTRIPEVVRIAEAHDRTPAQIVLRWHVQSGAVPIPKSSCEERMAENIDVFGFELSGEEMARIDAQDSGDRQQGDPDVHEEF